MTDQSTGKGNVNFPKAAELCGSTQRSYGRLFHMIGMPLLFLSGWFCYLGHLHFLAVFFLNGFRPCSAKFKICFITLSLFGCQLSARHVYFPISSFPLPHPSAPNVTKIEWTVMFCDLHIIWYLNIISYLRYILLDMKNSDNWFNSDDPLLLYILPMDLLKKCVR